MKVSGLVILGALTLSSCAKPFETRVSSAGKTAISPGTFETLKPPELAVSDGLKTATDLVVQRLLQKQFFVESDASFLLNVTLSSRPASLAVVEKSDAGSKQLGQKNAKAKNNKKCQPREDKLSVVLTGKADGTIIYHGSAAEFHCAQPLSDVIPFLAASAVADLGAPRGDYVVKRKSKN